MKNPFTHKNLKDVEDKSEGYGTGDIQEARFATEDLEAEETGFSHHRIRAGKRQGFGHRHEEAEEVYVVMAGAGRVKLDDEIIDIVELDAIRISPEVTRQFEAAEEEDLVLIAFGPRKEGDGEMVPGWWA